VARSEDPKVCAIIILFQLVIMVLGTCCKVFPSLTVEGFYSFVAISAANRKQLQNINDASVLVRDGMSIASYNVKGAHYTKS
jgi:hypothetical protein